MFARTSSLIALLLVLPVVAFGSDLEDERLRELVGAEVYDRITELSNGKPNDLQRAVLETFAEHRAAFEAYVDEDPSSHQAAREGLRELFLAGGGEKNIDEVHWLRKVKIIDEATSRKMAQVRNLMVREACEELTCRYGEVHRMDFSPAEIILNDIDHTFKVPDALKELGIDGPTFVREFEAIYQAKFGIDPNYMDVVSHPFEARFPDWRERTKFNGRSNVEVHDFVGRLRKGSALLGANPEAYFLEGAFRMQIERRSYESDLDLYTIFGAEPRKLSVDGRAVPDSDVARVAIVARREGTIRKHLYRYIPPPEMRRSYAWGSSVGNWHFASKHEFGTRFLAKYGLRSFSESVGWMVLFDTAENPEGIGPRDYEKMIDLSERVDLLRTVYDRHYGGLEGLSFEEVRWTLERAAAIRNAKGDFNLESAFGGAARAEVKGDQEAYQRRKAELLQLMDERFCRNMKKIMVENIKVSLPGRLVDWLDPDVSPFRLGFTQEDLDQRPDEVKQTVDAARKKLRVAALFEVLHGLRTLDPGDRLAVIARAKTDLAARRGNRQHTFEHTLKAIETLAMQEAKTPHLLQTDDERLKKTRLVGESEGKRVKVSEGDEVAAAIEHQRDVRRKLLATFEELSAAANLEIRPHLESTAAERRIENLPAGLKKSLLQGATRAKRYFTTQWDNSLREADETLQRSVEAGVAFMISKGRRKAAINSLRRVMWEHLGYEFRKDWSAVEDMDLEKDLLGFSKRRLASSLCTWNNADSLMNIVRVYRDTNGNTEAVGGAILQEAATRLPMVGEVLQLKAILEGEAHPAMLGVMAAGFYYPPVGTVMIAYSISTNTYVVLTDVYFDSHAEHQLRGSIPDANGTPGPGAAVGGLPELKGMLAPAYQAMLERRKQLERELALHPEKKEQNEYLLNEVWTRDFAGTLKFVYEFYNPELEAKLMQDLSRWPREQWKAIKLSSDMSKVRMNDPANMIRPENLSPLLRAFFRPYVRDYLNGTGRFAEMPGHVAAHGNELISERYFFSGDDQKKEYNETEETMVSILTLGYQKALIEQHYGDDPRFRFDFAWDEAPVSINAYLRGLAGKRITAYDPEYRDRPAIPDLPSFFDVIPAGETVEEKRAGFFSHFDGVLNEKLKARDEKFGDSPEERWLEIKLGLKHADTREEAPEEGAVQTPLLTAFFNKWVTEYSKAVDAEFGHVTKEGPVSRIDPTLPRARYRHPDFVVHPEAHKRMVTQLVSEYRAGLIRAESLAQSDRNRRMLDAALPNATVLEGLARAVWGAAVGGSLTPEPGAAESLLSAGADVLAVVTDDPCVEPLWMKKVEDLVGGFLAIPSESIIEITGVPPGEVGPDDLLHLACHVRATYDYIRPFRVSWTIASGGGAASSPGDLDEAGELKVTRLLVANEGEAIESSSFQITAHVEDATGRKVGEETAIVRLAGREQPDITATPGVRVMMVNDRPPPGGINQPREGTGVGRWLTPVEIVRREPSEENAHALTIWEPELWIRWNEAPQDCGYYVKGTVRGGAPPVGEELVSRLSGYPNFPPDSNNPPGPRTAFTVKIPLEKGHAGDFAIEGTVFAYRGRTFRDGEILGEMPFSVPLHYHLPPDPEIEANVSLHAAGALSGTFKLRGAQDGKRIVAVRIAGRTWFDQLGVSSGGTTIKLLMYGVHEVPATAEITYRDFGVDRQVTVPLEVERKGEWHRINETEFDRVLGLIQDAIDDGRLDRAAREYETLVQYCTSGSNIILPDLWGRYVSSFYQYAEAAIPLMANPDWPGYSWGSETIPEKREGARYQQRTMIVRVIDFANRAARYLMANQQLEHARAHLDKAQGWIGSLPQREVSSNLGKVAGSLFDLAKATFHETGDLSAASSLWNEANALRARSAQLAGRQFQSRPLPWTVDPLFR